jgi:HK97 gp10 family phage protein
LGKALSEFAPKFQKNVLRGALRAGMKPVRTQARANVTKQSGALARGLKVSTNSRGTMVYSKLKTSGKHDYVARFIEFGTARHWISSKKGKMLRIAGVNGDGNSFVVFKDRVDHPGARPLPFMRPALDAQAEAAVVATGEYIRGRLTEQGINIPDSGDES